MKKRERKDDINKILSSCLYSESKAINGKCFQCTSQSHVQKYLCAIRVIKLAI